MSATFLPLLQKSKSAVIVNNASALALCSGVTTSPSYNSSKAAGESQPASLSSSNFDASGRLTFVSPAVFSWWPQSSTSRRRSLVSHLISLFFSLLFQLFRPHSSSRSTPPPPRPPSFPPLLSAASSQAVSSPSPSASTPSPPSFTPPTSLAPPRKSQPIRRTRPS